jgi:hypothetical protein
MDVQPTQHARNVDTKGLLIRKVICFDKAGVTETGDNDGPK